MTDSQTTGWMGELRTRLGARLDETLREASKDFSRVGREPLALWEAAQPPLAQGKRLRAAFAAAGWQACGGEALSDVIVSAGACLELFQLAALVHDDIIDDSATRRGLPSAHIHFSQGHHEAQLLGDGDRFGRNAALLLGDLLLVTSTAELERAVASIPAQSAQKARRILLAMMTEVTLGQYLDIYAQSAPFDTNAREDSDRALRVVRAKSARYSVEHPFTLGAAMAGADEDVLELCSQIGLPVGEAFQLRDDLLGVFGQSSTTGKPAGDDLREGKRTLLITTALERADRAQRNYLTTHLGSGELTTSELGALRQILEDTGARDHIEGLISARMNEAMDLLAGADFTRESVSLIADLAAAATDRSA